MMNDSQALISAKELISAAKLRGAEISETQLRRWQREGLVPQVKKQGLGQGAGSASYYPEEALDHAIAAQSYLKHNYSMKKAGWLMWLDGLSVSEKYWLTPIYERAIRLEDITNKIRNAFDGDDEIDIYELIKGAIEHRDSPPILRQIRKSLGAERSVEFFETIILAFIGEFARLGSGASRADDLQALKTSEIGIMTGQGRFARVGHDRFYTGDISDDIRTLSRAFVGVNWRELVRDVTPFERARSLTRQTKALATDFQRSAIKAGGKKLEKLAKRLNSVVFVKDIDLQVIQFLMILAWNRHGDFQRAMDDLCERFRRGD